MPPLPLCIVFAIYPGMTQLDFTGPHQFLSRLPGATTLVASRDGGEVPSEGLTFAHTTRLADVPDCDLLCVPGGGGALRYLGLHGFTDYRRGRATHGATCGLPLGVA
ncbi:hypothetical protein [Acidocella sp.]|uniref:hypothetical protein n=1 Tax=Acidocella sp. TaxID=50710 RepID=UPI0026285168|nr:hypothetical protein [Acidocella sp.]